MSSALDAQTISSISLNASVSVPEESASLPIKLLITARDPATAVSWQILVPYLLEHTHFQIKLLLQEPAIEILQQSLLANGGVNIADIDLEKFAPQANLEAKMHKVKGVFHDFQPDAVLTGISGPDIGVDEATLKVAEEHNIPSYALQSFWGDINQATGALPNTAFVLDDEAKHITAQRYPTIQSVPIGSIKHVDFKNYDSLAIRKSKRPSLVDFANNEVLVSFYGQPILDIKGYFATIEALVRQLKNWHRPFKIMYRPHPKESGELKSKTWDLFEKAFADKVFWDETESLIESLCVSDLVVSAFSTCGFDSLYLNEMASKAFNSSVYLWFDTDLINWWQDYSGLEEMPLKSEDLLLMVDKEETMLEVFEQGLKTEVQQRLRQNAKLHLPDPSNAVDKMIVTIQQDFLNLRQQTT